MTNPFETLRKILQNEAARGYDNKGMVGGIDKFIPAFEQQARKANVEEALIAEVVGWMRQYAALSLEDRAKAMSDLLARLPVAVPSPQRPTEPNTSRNRPSPSPPWFAARKERRQSRRAFPPGSEAPERSQSS